ncbi:MAG: pyridoxal-phosphate dependent enzyme [Clostridiales bacterium]|nr:pyridoxal-phosphate dependent enzyme [Clostridiales bacterium]
MTEIITQKNEQTITQIITQAIPQSKTEYLADYCGCSIFIKRDDLIPFSFGGNKVRIAGEIMKEITAGGYTALITYGSPGSNMNRAAACSAAAAGISCYAVIKMEDDEDTGHFNNELLVKKSGAEIVYCTRDNVRESVEEVVLRSKAKGERPYYIYGDSTGQGNEAVLMRASFNEYREITAYEREAGEDFDHIVLTVGTGMTAGGLCAAILLSGGKERITGISAARPSETALGAIKKNLRKVYGLDCPDGIISVRDDYLCGGYGKYDRYIEAVIKRVREDTGICLDPTYTGKAFAGLLKEAQAGRISGRVLFIHTGGYPVYADWAEGDRSSGSGSGRTACPYGAFR